MRNKPKVSPQVQKEIDHVEKQLNAQEDSVKSLTLDEMKKAPVEEVEPQTKLSSKEIEKSKDVYLKPERTIGSKEKFNESFRDDYNFKKEYVQFIAENKEVIGETIELWTKPFPGLPAEFWKVPVNKPVWGPRYLAERIHGCTYHRFIQQDSIMNGSDGRAQYYGAMAVDTTIQRLDAQPVSQRKSIFMGKF